MDKDVLVKALNTKLAEVGMGALMGALTGKREETLVHLGYGDALFDILNALDGAPARSIAAPNFIEPFTL